MARRNRALCVRVAKDVIAQLRVKRYQATPGRYVEVDTSELPEDLIFADNYFEGSFKDLFKKNKAVTCNVCALGSAFVSLVNIKNECTVEDMTDDMLCYNIMLDRLEAVFGGENMSLMESAFEISPAWQGGYGETEEEATMLDEAVVWGEQYDDPDQRLRAIMLNVIRNGGDFKLPKAFMKNVERRIEELNEEEAEASRCNDKSCEICY